MPVIKSAEKQLRQSIKAREKNYLQREDMKKSLKDLEKLLVAKKYDEAKKKVTEVYSKLDRLAKRNVIHPNKASRKKGQIMRKINKAGK